MTNRLKHHFRHFNSAALIEASEAYKRHLVRLEREDGLPRIVVRDMASGEEHFIQFDEEAYSLGMCGSLEYDTDFMRFSYSSMTTPADTYFHSATRSFLAKATMAVFLPRPLFCATA